MNVIPTLDFGATNPHHKLYNNNLITLFTTTFPYCDITLEGPNKVKVEIHVFFTVFAYSHMLVGIGVTKTLGI